MKTYVQRQQATPKTIQSKASNQASAEEVLQSYKKKIVQMQSMYEDEPLQGKFNDTAQREEPDEEELLQGKFDTAQREEIDEDELLQGKPFQYKAKAKETYERMSQTHGGGNTHGGRTQVPKERREKQAKQSEEAVYYKMKEKHETRTGKTLTEEETVQLKPNSTGLPDNLKNGIEDLSGYSMDDVHVHYNSPKPAQLQSLAYAQGTDIHVAPGQEQHLPHEAWHVVQQKQGRVQPTMQMQGINVNDNEGLEREADVMGGEALLRKSIENSIKKDISN